jgi:hypothetical protein
MKCESPYLNLNLGAPTIKFAEENICGWIAQPANTFSNISFIIVALIIFSEIKKRALPKTLYGFPITIFIIGLASFFYHASATFIGQFLDFDAIYVFTAYICFLAFSQKYENRLRLLIIALVVTVLIQSLLLWYIPSIRIVIFALELLGFLVVEFTNNQKDNNIQYLRSALAIFLVSWSIWLLDILHIWDYKPLQHILNGHAIWHIGTSISLYFVYRFKRYPMN